MIDLNIRTNYSDGCDSVRELLEKVNKKKLDVISITDYNSCLAYFELDNINLKDVYIGKIIVGCCFTTSFNDRTIEVLGYGFDYKRVQDYLNNYYNRESVNENLSKLYERVVCRICSLGLKCGELNEMRKFDGDFFEKDIYSELVKEPINREILDEDIWDSFDDFYRRGLTNPKSKLFMNYPEFSPSLDEIIDVIQENGGIVFLAHPYEYKFDDINKFLKDIYCKYNFDGIECFCTSSSDKEIKYLLDFARKRGLLISGGSNYHGTDLDGDYLGNINSNLLISSDILEDWNIDIFN